MTASPLVRSWPFLRPELPRFGLALALAPLSAAAVVAQPWLLKTAIDGPIAARDLAGIREIALLYLAAVVFEFLTSAVHTVLLARASMNSIAALRAGVYRHAIGLSRAWYDKTPTGRLLTRTTNDIEALGETLTAGAVTIVIDALQVLGILAAMAWLDLGLTALLIAMSPLLVLLIEVMRRKLKVQYDAVRDATADLNAFLAERLAGLEIIQLYRAESRARADHEQRLGTYRDASIATNIWDALLYAAVDGIGAVTTAAVLWYGSGGLFEGVISAGLIAAFVDYVGKLFRPIQEFSAKVAILQRASTSLEKIVDLLDEPLGITPGTRDLEQVEGRLSFQDVGFAYEPGTPILRDLSLQVAPGEVVAVVGRTGSGKTTLGRLLTRSYDGYTGSITIDGHEVSDLRPAGVRRAIGVVRQEVQLFDGDVRFNISLGHTISDERLAEAIEAAQATELVRRLGGLDGAVASRGANLSVGEAQLLSFARTLAHDPKVIVLDEATASVDSLTEARIQAATRAVLAGRTVIIIAHRLSTITHANRIAVLDAGQVVELGTHAELMARSGVYATMVRAQELESREAS
jgi:ATP-binding cassette subfamily B multidrug efflux pump